MTVTANRCEGLLDSHRFHNRSSGCRLPPRPNIAIEACGRPASATHNPTTTARRKDRG